MENRIEAIKPREEANEKKEQGLDARQASIDKREQELNAKESDIVTREQKVMQQEAQAAQQSYGYAQQESSTYSGNSASDGSAGGAYYKNCKAVWDVLGHDITRNDPGYRSKLDADGDGYACEYPPNY